MKYGARNQITATVTTIKKGGLMAQVGLQVNDPATMASVMTQDSLESLDLKEGDEVRVVIKAIHVLVVRD